jgi:DNA-binding ferritin-like protein (Dps family)
VFFYEYEGMEEVQKPSNTKCNIELSAPCKTDNLICLLGWTEELQTLRKQYQEGEMRLTELQNKYRAAKKTAVRYKLWAGGKEQHIQQEWQLIVVGLQNVLEVVQAKAQAALTDSAVTDSSAADSAVTDSAAADSAVG